MSSHVLAIDEGGTGVRAFVFDAEAHVVGSAYAEIPLSCPQAGWVEHDPEAVWERTVSVGRTALVNAGLHARDLAGIGVTNQRASVVAWDARNGRPLYPIIGWQDLRTIEHCEELGRRGYTLSPLQSASKFAWILEHVPDARACAEAGRLRLGTIDAWLTWRLSNGEVYVTDPSNASCTGVYDFITNGWDDALIEQLRLPRDGFASMVGTGMVAGATARDAFGATVPLAARAGDQQAAMFGQLRTETGAIKVTYGTAAMMDVNVGTSLRLSPHGAFPLVLWERDGVVSYCLEGTAVTAGAAVQWLRDGLGIIADPIESGPLADSVADTGGVWCVPAFQGLGTPHVDTSARALIGGLSRATGRAHVVRAVLEGIAFRCREILEAMQEDIGGTPLDVLRVDGGAARNDFLMQCQADLTGVPVERPAVLEATCLGAAYLAGLATGVWGDVSELARTWRRDRLFEPRMTADERAQRYERWRAVVKLTRMAP